MSEWTWSVGPGASSPNPGPERQLTAAYGRVLTRRVAGHHFAAFSINGRHDEAADIRERETDLWVWRDGILLHRGRIVSAQDQIGPSSHTTTFQSVDYRGMLTLAAAAELPVPTFNGVDQAQIAWQLVQHRQGQSGGSWGITQGVGASSGQSRDETQITAGTPIGEIIDRIFKRQNGGEWEISPDLKLNRWFPKRGVSSGVVLDYGGVLSSIQGSTAKFGNAAVATGSEDTTPVLDATVGVGTDPRGRWTVTEGNPSIETQTSLIDRAAWILGEASTIEHEWSATFSAQRWEGPGHVEIGDTVALQIKSGRLTVAGSHRVMEMQHVLDGDGGEQTTVGLVGVAA